MKNFYKNLEKKLLKEVSKSDFSQKIKKIFPDAELLKLEEEK